MATIHLSRKLDWRAQQIARRDIGNSSKVILFFLVEFSDSDGISEASQTLLSTLSNLKRSAVKSCLRQLTDAGVIRRIPRRNEDGGGLESLYGLNIDRKSWETFSEVTEAGEA